MPITEDIEKFNILKVLNDAEKNELSKRLKKIEFKKDEQIWYMGDPGTSMFLLLKGSVDVTIVNEGLEYTIASLKKGDVFGEMSLLTGEPRTVNIKAAAPVTVFKLKKKDFEILVEQYPSIRDKILILLAKGLKKSVIARHADQVKSDEVVIELLSRNTPPVSDHFPGLTRWSEAVETKINELSMLQDKKGH